MSRNKIVFRGNGDEKIGLGHISRLTSVANHLKGKYDRVLVVNNYSSALQQLTNNAFEEILELKGNENITDNAAGIESYIDIAPVIVADGYGFDATYQKRIKGANKKLVYIDDLAAFEMYADVVVNHALGISPSLYTGQHYTKYCLGPGYLMLRTNFLNALPISSIKKNSILLCFGGADPDNYTKKVLDSCDEIEGLIWNVVIGPSNKNFVDKKHNGNVNLLSNLSADEMVKQMQSNSLMICSPSTVSYEACSVGIPLIVIQTADNQNLIREGLVKNSCARYIEANGLPHLPFNIREILTIDSIGAEMLEKQKQIFRSNVSFNFTNLFEQLYA